MNGSKWIGKVFLFIQKKQKKRPKRSTFLFYGSFAVFSPLCFFFDPCARNNHRHRFVFFCINFFLSSSFVLFVQCSSISFTNMVEITLTGISTVCVFGAIYHVHSLRCVCDVHGLMTAAGCLWLLHKWWMRLKSEYESFFDGFFFPGYLLFCVFRPAYLFEWLVNSVCFVYFVLHAALFFAELVWEIRT